MSTCKIQWIDDSGRPTPDSNEAVGEVFRESYTSYVYKKPYTFPETERFPICAKHARLLSDPGMENWKFEPK